jgi:hypothetical protein
MGECAAIQMVTLLPHEWMIWPLSTLTCRYRQCTVHITVCMSMYLPSIQFTITAAVHRRAAYRATPSVTITRSISASRLPDQAR